MENDVFEELAKYDLKDCKMAIFDDVYTYLKDKHSLLNSIHAIKEAGSREATPKVVLTD